MNIEETGSVRGPNGPEGIIRFRTTLKSGAECALRAVYRDFKIVEIRDFISPMRIEMFHPDFYEWWRWRCECIDYLKSAFGDSAMKGYDQEFIGVCEKDAAWLEAERVLGLGDGEPLFFHHSKLPAREEWK